MSGFLFLLGELDTPDLVSKGTFVSATTRDWLIVFGAITLLTLVLMGVVLFLRKRKEDASGGRRHHHHHHHHHHHTDESVASTSADGAESGHHRRKWRRRRREHRPRNPTLAETGGLPPIRQQEPPSSAP